MHPNTQKREHLARLVLWALVFTMLSSAPVLGAVEIITLRYRSPGEVMQIVRPMLSPDGKISADERSYTLIIVDSEEAIARIMQSLAVIDRPVRQATVRVRFQESGQQEQRSVSGGGRVSSDSGSVSAGRGPRGRDGVDVRAQDRTVSRSASSEVFINALSGSWSYIRVGQDIPYSVRWADLCRRHGRAVTFQRIETGFDVKALIQDDLADVEIVPRLSEAGSGGQAGVVRFAEAATRAQVPLGRWFTLAGSDQGGSEMVRAILEAGSSRQSSALSIQLSVEAH